ncbi:hypothetical protein CAS74_001377 [Pichia kudriavzevii]|uniref:Putative mannosyltransferase KTR4 n=1 Tax=Pichia kudriavzevii TaxID=4909 RepID=A0A099P6V1_PICKU|nr:uncharacterized protein C5L36_0A01850 [Pichia kudriavzevii]AWU73578.1 hypothetical protein C5L36_0A01850 [Pichia kudriavzevii]KGK39969.1 hypothetical protein JL09_g892 [Pichia kudriavzevii]ONH71772.1 putative mannosyltransferase KTR4 [Pichia kudriavzevii]OUT23070.1 hypothetical protein CAS74_001377 [Pichia kudriavzevii]
METGGDMFNRRISKWLFTLLLLGGLFTVSKEFQKRELPKATVVIEETVKVETKIPDFYFNPLSEYEGLSRDQVVKKNYDKLVKIMETPIDEPKGVLTRSNGDRANATMMVLAKNSDLKGVLYTLDQIESTFNKKFHYPYVFLNDNAFSEHFKSAIRKHTDSECYFETIDPSIWNQPDWIDPVKQQKLMSVLKSQNIQYANKISYHNMCRFYSMSFYNHPRMQQFRYYWRFEPNTDYFTNIDYDVFKFMEDNDKIYGFTIALYDAHETVKTLWTETKAFIGSHPEYVHPNSAASFISENLQNPEKTEYTQGYSTCHFWSNFEIGDMEFYRSEAYTEWMKHLDEAGGFYYERWGDAPVHSLGVSLFADKKKVHWFRDIGYRHHPYTNCPTSRKCKGCTPGEFCWEGIRDQNCLTNWWNYEMDEQDRSVY